MKELDEVYELVDSLQRHIGSQSRGDIYTPIFSPLDVHLFFCQIEEKIHELEGRKEDESKEVAKDSGLLP